MSEQPPMTEAQRRAAARKAKILARGNAGLARLAHTARGDEANMLYGDDSTGASPADTPSSSAPASRPQTPSATSSFPPASSTSAATAAAASAPSATAAAASRPSAPAASAVKPKPASNKAPGWAPPAASQRASRAAADPMAGMFPPGMGGPSGAGMPSQEEMAAQMEAMMNMLGGGGGAGGAGGPPDMAKMMAALMGGMPPPGAGDGPGLLGDGTESPNPFGTPGANPFAGMDPSQNPFAAMGGGDGQNPFAGLGAMGGMPGAMAAPPTKAQRLFPALHAIAVLALVAFVAVWWEPTLRLVRAGGEGGIQSWAVRWAALAGRAGSWTAKTVEPLPVFYAFVTLELILLATRVTLTNNRPALHPLLANVLPMLPPALGATIRTGSKYLGVGMQTYKDGCLFLFGLGAVIVLAEFLAK